MKDKDLISDKTRLNRSLIVSAGFECFKVKDGKTKDLDRFMVIMPVMRGDRVIEKKIVRHKLRRDGFIKFLNRMGKNLVYKPVVDEY